MNDHIIAYYHYKWWDNPTKRTPKNIKKLAKAVAREIAIGVAEGKFLGEQERRRKWMR